MPQWGQKVGGCDSTASVTTHFFPNLLNLSHAYCASEHFGDPKCKAALLVGCLQEHL